MKEKIVVYTSETCPYCKTVKEKFESENIEFEERLVSKYEKEWLYISELTGMPQLPTIISKNKHLVPGRDFYNQDHLISLLDSINSSETNVEYDIATFERIKTLNFNIFSAFNRLEATLQQIESKLSNDSLTEEQIIHGEQETNVKLNKEDVNKSTS